MNSNVVSPATAASAPSQPDPQAAPSLPAEGTSTPSQPGEGGDVLEDGQALEASGLPGVPGYSDTAGAPLAPPSAVPVPATAPPRDQMPHSSAVSEETAREALLSFVSENCCYGKGAARTITLNEFTPHIAHHYILDTFTEARSTKWTHRPYIGGDVDDASRGVPPLPWNIPNNQLPAKFTNYVEGIPVPHTEVVKTCFRCCGTGLIRCNSCHGRGQKRCSWCHGSGSRRKHTKDGWETTSCSSCHGRGHTRCHHCSGSGRITCPVCRGARMLTHFILLTIEWHTYTDDVIQQMTTLPDHLVRAVTGDTVFEEEDLSVFPVSHCPEESMNVSSTQLLDKHRISYQSHRQHRQRHRIRIVPNTEVDSEFKKKKHTFYIYGLENKVHFPTYPQKCCWGCTIM